MNNDQNNDDLSSLYSKPVLRDSSEKNINDLQVNNQNANQTITPDNVQPSTIDNAQPNTMENNSATFIDNQNPIEIEQEIATPVDNSNYESNTEVQQITNEPLQASNNSGISNNDNIQEDNSLSDSDVNTNSFSDDDYIREFIGENSDKIMNKKFNFSAFFFEYVYFFYRKHYLFGIISILQFYIIPNVLDMFDLEIVPMIICSLIVSIILAILFNKSYINKAKKAVNLAKTNNSHDEIVSYLNQNGGTNGLYAFIGIVLFVVPQFMGFYSLANYDQWIVPPADGVTRFGSVVLKNKVDIVFPDEFVVQEDSIFDENTYYSYIYDYDEECNSMFDCEFCVIELYTVTEEKSAKSFAKRDAKYYDAKVSTTSKNGIKWYEYKYDYDDFGYELKYVTEKGGIIYSLSFSDSTKDNSCKKYFDSTLDSFKFK